MDAATTVDTRLSFSKRHPNLQTAWDSTSLGAFKTCPRYYQYSILEGYVTHAENVHLTFGIMFHECLEVYDRCKALGLDHEKSVLVAVKHALISTWDNALGRPWTTDEPTKTRDTLLRSIIWYFDQFENDPCETIIQADGRPAVELSFRFEPGFKSRLTGEDFLVCGHLDRLVKFQDRPWIMDRKTTKTTLSQEYFGRYSPDNQMSLYHAAGTLILNEPVSGLMVDAVQLAVTFSRFQRQPVTRTPAQLKEWMKDLWFWFKLAEDYAEAGYWPQNDRACNQYGGCPYRVVCGASEEVRQKLLDGLYTKRSWDPLEVRGAVP